MLILKIHVDTPIVDIPTNMDTTSTAIRGVITAVDIKAMDMDMVMAMVIHEAINPMKSMNKGSMI